VAAEAVAGKQAALVDTGAAEAVADKLAALADMSAAEEARMARAVAPGEERAAFCPSRRSRDSRCKKAALRGHTADKST